MGAVGRRGSVLDTGGRACSDGWPPGCPLVAALVGTLEGAVVVGGLSALGAALYSIGIPKYSIVRYETALKSDQYLIIVHGSQKEVEQIHEILAAGEPTDAAIHLS